MALPVLLHPFVYDLGSIGRKARVPFDAGAGGQRHDFQRSLGTPGIRSGGPPPAGEERDGGNNHDAGNSVPPEATTKRRWGLADGNCGVGIFLKIVEREPYVLNGLKSAST